MLRTTSTILGGLPVFVEIDYGKDADTPNGAGEYWSEVQAIYWLKKDGTPGKEIPQHLYDKAEKQDPYFSALIEQAEWNAPGAEPSAEMVAFEPLAPPPSAA